MKRMRVLLALALVFALVVPPAAANAGAFDLEQLAGADRYATAVAISNAYVATSDAVVLATGLTWPDALGGSGLAGALGAPILLTPPDHLPPVVVAELRSLAPAKVFVLGGASAVRDTVLAEVRGAVPSATIVRLGGVDRYDTACKVASETVSANATWDHGAFVSTGATFADALSAGPVAAALGRPLYLIAPGTPADRVLASMRTLGVTDITILGGYSAVPAALETRLAGLVGASHVARLQGPDRFATALAIAAYGESHAAFTWARPGIATNDGFADALAAAPLLGARRSPLLLSPAVGLPDVHAATLYARRLAVGGFVLIGGQKALPPHIREEVQLALAAPHLDIGRVMAHVRTIAGYGARPAGGAAEAKGLDYAKAQLASWGYSVTEQVVSLPGGKQSRNVIAEKAGLRPEIVVVGAHVDSKYPSPGANDNATGVAILLELARDLRDAPVQPTVRFVVFGAEEVIGTNSDAHHFGSRQYVASLSEAQRASIVAMLDIDMVGYGSSFYVRSMGHGPMTAVTALRNQAGFMGQALAYRQDPSWPSGWSDHEAFERAGIPVAWLEWLNDPVYHTAGDVASHVQSTRVRITGRLARAWILGMTPAEIDALR